MRAESNLHGEVLKRPGHRRARSVFVWLGILLVSATFGLAAAADLMLRRAAPILKQRIVDTLTTRFNSRVELDRFNVSVLHGFDVSGEGLRIYPPEDLVAAGEARPLIAVRQFSFHAGLRALFFKPMHIATAHVTGMIISVPPREMRERGSSRSHPGKIEVLVDTLIFDDSRFVLQSSNPSKDPKNFELRHIEMQNYGGASPLRYHAVLWNAIPRGSIDASGTFGPWNTESPGDSAATGRYTFDHADLHTIHGIGGTLRSDGEFSGPLNRIDVSGTTDTPDFSLDSANHPMPLKTKFHAIVDGITGDTYLMPVDARLGRSEFSCKGAVINLRGKGHVIDLDVTVPNGHVEDFLRLAEKTKPLVTGRLQTHSRLYIRPGKEALAERVEVKSDFSLSEIHFTNSATEDKLDDLSLRAQGRPDEAKPGAPDVHSNMAGSFAMRSGYLDFSRLEYRMPGGSVQLAGTYSLTGEELNFAGNIRTEAKLSQMVASRWKAWMLKAVDPFFHRDGSGAVIPIRIFGTKDDPKFSLDLSHSAEAARAAHSAR